MTAHRTPISRAAITSVIGLFALSALALALPPAASPDRIVISSHAYVVPSSADELRTLLPDGRILEVHGTQGIAYLIDGSTRQTVVLPEPRRYASVTVMPGGQVLFWGGIDVRGQVLENGEWFNPSTQQFVRTGALGLPARAGHTLSILTDGTALMTGGWSVDGSPATTAVLWQPQSRQATVLADAVPATPRLEANAMLQADGSVRIEGGIDGHGHDVREAWHYRPASLMTPSTVLPAIAAVSPAKDSTNASIHGPVVLRFDQPVDVHQLNRRTVTLLGPEGVVNADVIGAEGGRLAFVQLPDDLYPGSRYTLFIKGLHTSAGAPVPYTTLGFATARTDATDVVIVGQGHRPAADSSSVVAQPPLYVMAGGGKAVCKDDQLCRRKSFLRDGAWYPGQDNAPDFTGAHWRLYAPHQTLPDTRTLESGLPKGTTALIGQVRQIDETPVANVEVSIGGIETRTDANGVFVLRNLPDGRQEMFVNGEPASHGDLHYGRFVVGADIKAKAISHMPFVMYLPRILPRDEITLPTPTTREVVLTHPDMPGLELHVPAGAVFKDRHGKVLDHIALVPTPVDHAPFPLPANFPMYFTIMPGDAVVQGLTPEASQGIRVVYPNYGHLQPASHADFWAYSAKDGWGMYGAGRASADAKHLEPDPGVAFTMALGAGVSASTTPGGTAQKPGNKCKGQPVDLQTGLMFHRWDDVAIHDVLPLALQRTYTSGDASSHAFGIGGSSNVGMYLTNTSNNWNSMTVVLSCGENITFNLTSGTATWPFPSGTVWTHTGTNSTYYGATMQFVFGATPDTSYWVMTLKDGTQYGLARHAPNALQWIQDRYGNQIQLVYNGGLLQQMTSPSGRSMTFNYDTGNRITSIIDNSNRTVNYAYDSAGTLATVTYPDKTTEQYTYDANHRMLTMQDRRGTIWVTNQYDGNGRVTKQTYADSASYQFAYTTDSNNTVTATMVTDPNGNQEQVQFDPVSLYPSSDTYAYGTNLAQTTTYKREASGLLDSETDALGRTTTYTHDAMGNVISVTKLAGTPNAVTTSFTYTSDYNQLASVTDPLSHTTTFSYTKGCLTQITNALGNSTTIQCNSAGQPISMQDALGNTGTFQYQGYDLQNVTDALGRTVSYVVDTLGRTTAIRDPLGNVTLTQYDSNDRVIQVTNALNQATSVTYDANGNPTSISLPNQTTLSSTYDNRNRRITRTDALGQSESWTYDGMGNVLTYTDRNKQQTVSSYDALNRHALTSFADGSGIQVSYDAGNRLTGLLDSANGQLSWGYDGLDRVTSTVTPQGTITYGYDAANRRTNMTPAAQPTVIYGYDNANRLTSITQGSETVQLGYDNANRRTKLTLPNGVTVSYGYDQVSQLISLMYAQGNGASLGNLAYAYDAAGRRISKTGTLATDLLPTPSTQPATFDANNRQTSFNAQALSYDANGNLTSDGTNTYTWNARNQLTQISQGGVAQLSYSYDALGRRTAKTVMSGTPTQYLYDGQNAVQEAQGTTINPILTGPGIDERFARNDVTGRTYFLADALGSTIGLADTTGALREQYSYDPYGNVNLSDTTTGFTNPYQYTGREADAPGLYYYRARYYSPTWGRFISEDPLGFGGGQNNFYAYVGGNPLNHTDPLGLDDTYCRIDPSSCGWNVDNPTYANVSVGVNETGTAAIVSESGEWGFAADTTPNMCFYATTCAAAATTMGAGGAVGGTASVGNGALSDGDSTTAMFGFDGGEAVTAGGSVQYDPESGQISAARGFLGGGGGMWGGMMVCKSHFYCARKGPPPPKPKPKHKC
ncbi:RHS repeat-associated core domain protein [Burkholderia pseudomallei]|uniref:RHS repeat-associated core domain-containing protein n=1 Tax=Burkholderia pseudomallei TaxID=28450 RepID=UPI00293C7B02|nr:RHS repeat-associated core domain protein [Burkholderia pseudomallei]